MHVGCWGVQLLDAPSFLFLWGGNQRGTPPFSSHTGEKEKGAAAHIGRQIFFMLKGEWGAQINITWGLGLVLFPIGFKIFDSIPN